MLDENRSLMVGAKHALVQLGRVLVLGLGVSGKAAVRYLLPLVGTRVESITVAAGVENDDSRVFAAGIEAAGVRVLFDHYDIADPYDLGIVSPGISQFSPFYKSAQTACTELMSEVEFAWRESPVDSVWVAVTGTNGKTTTTALLAHVLQTCGRTALPVGNIGDTCLEALTFGNNAIFVAETSSYQLASTILFAPSVAIVLNITPDHLHWHQSLEAYEQAKLKVLANLRTIPGAVAILGAVDPVVRATIKRLKDMPAEQRGFDYIPLGTKAGLSSSMRLACGSENAGSVQDGVLCVEVGGVRHAFIAASDLMIKGDHNVENALAAAAAAVALGCGDEEIARGLASFAPLEHRIEPVGSVRGVQCYNDSKATNVDATLQALSAFGDEKIIALFGGEDKGTDLADLVARAEAHCKAVICFGAARKRMRGAFVHAVLSVHEELTMEAALDRALECAQSGDIVILSPACASFDEFESFEQRGLVFKQLVAQRSEARGA